MAPVTDAERERIRELHAEGMSANAIAKEIKRAQSTVSYQAQQMGLSFDRAPVIAANQARRADAESRRRDLTDALLDDVERLRVRLWSPYEVIQYVGKDGERVTDQFDVPPPQEQLTFMRALGLAIDKHTKLVDFDREKDESRLAMADQFLQMMMGGAPGGDTGGE